MRNLLRGPFGAFPVAIFVALFSLPAGGQHPASPLPKLVLTSQFNGLEPEESFSCGGRIHGTLTLPNPVVGAHILESRWIMPNGSVKENVFIPLEFTPPGRQTAYVWLDFQQTSEGFLGFSSRSTEEADRKYYDGEWRVELAWNGNPMISQNFKVKC